MNSRLCPLIAGLLMGGVTLPMVPSAYSQAVTNAVTVTVPTNSMALIGNPLNRGSNTLAEILPNVPVSTVVFAFVPSVQNFVAFTFRGHPWRCELCGVFEPGRGFFVANFAPTNLTVTFVGTVPAEMNTITINPGFNLLASPVPLAERLETDLGLPVVNGDKVYKLKTESLTYELFVRRTTRWFPSEPVIAVAEGFFIQTTNTARWKVINPVPRP
jgi:hypothetical protein